MPKKSKILIVDDHNIVRESIADALADSPSSRTWEVVGHAADGLDAVAQAEKLKPDVVILDIGLPRLDGISVLRRIRAMGLGTRVVVFSTHDDQAHVLDAIRAEADAYLFKDQSNTMDLVRCVEDLLAGRAPFEDKLHKRLFAGVRLMDESSLDRGLPLLTPAELDVLRLAAFRGGSMKEIASTLSRPDRSLSEATVKRHFENIYQKLGASSQSHAVCLAIKHGLIDPNGAEASPR